MSRGKGNAAPAWVAAYLQPWWPGCEKTPNSHPGRDILGTLPVAFEVKTGAEWRHSWIAQSQGYAGEGELAVLVYLPPGLGAAHVGAAHMIVPLAVGMQLLTGAGWAPEPRPRKVEPW